MEHPKILHDGITFDDAVLNAIYFDYRHARNLGTPMSPNNYASHADDAWRSAAIDLLTEKHLLSVNWTRHRIHVPHEKERLLDALVEGLTILKERRVDRMIRTKQEQLKDDISEETLMNVLLEIHQLNGIKKELAKQTGRVVVG